MPGVSGLDKQGGTYLLKSDLTVKDVKDVKDVCDGAGSLPAENDRAKLRTARGAGGGSSLRCARLCGKEN